MSVWWLVACGPVTPVAPSPSGSPGPTDETGTPSDTASPPSPTPVDSGWFGPRRGEGSVVLRHRYGRTELELVALFADEIPMVDAALCWPELRGACPPASPHVGQAVDWTPWMPTPRALFGIGPGIVLGPVEASRRADGLTGIVYEGRTVGTWEPGTTVDLVMPAAGLTTDDAVLLPPPVELLAPAPAEIVRLFEGQQRVLEWVPEPGPHRLTLELYGAEEPGAAPLRRLIALEDDGEYAIDVDGLGLRPENRRVTVRLVRSVRTEVTVDGDPVEVVARTEHTFVAEHPPIQGFSALPPGSDCTDAPLLEEGEWYGFMDTVADTFDLGDDGCTSGPTPGPDAAMRVLVEPGARIRIEGDRPGGDLSLYLLAGCDVDLCEAAADEAPANEREILVFTNTTDAPVERWLIVDGPSLGDRAPFRLRVHRDEPEVEGAPDSCSEAMAATTVSEGIHTYTLRGALDHLDPGIGRCAYSEAGGPDRMVPVSVPAGEVLHVEAAAPVVLYVLDDCVDENSCLAGAARYGTLHWTNAGTEARRVTVVVDSRADLPPSGPIDVEIHTHDPIEHLAPACDPAPPVLESGLHLIRAPLTGDAVDLAVPGPSCTFAPSAGPDGQIGVRIQPGERLEAQLSHPGDGVLALLPACGDGSAVVCDDRVGSGERIVWENTGSTPFEGVLLVDTWLNPGQPPVTVEVEVELRIE